MSADHLLLHLSARGEGSWTQFRAAVEELHVPDAASDEDAAGTGEFRLYQQLRWNLQRLAHVEFFTEDGDLSWRVAPPVIASIVQPEGLLGVVAGARSTRLIAKLESVAQHRLSWTEHDGCPRLGLIRGASERELVAIASEVGVRHQPDAPRALLGCLPPIDEQALRREVPTPFGRDWVVKRFDPATLNWIDASIDAALRVKFGLFEFTLAFRRHVLLRFNEKTFEIPASVGKYWVAHRARRRDLLAYNAATRRLTTYAVCRPPFLIERALVLCSGRPPEYQARPRLKSHLHYDAVPPDVAAFAAALLRQDLR